MDPDKSVVFAYDGVPAHLDLAIPAPYVHSLMLPPSTSLKRIYVVWKRHQRPTSRVRKFTDVQQE